MAKVKAKTSNRFPAVAMDPPNLSAGEWNAAMLLGLVFIVMAGLQMASFNDFKLALSDMGVGWPSGIGAVLILLELWASAPLFKLRLSYAFRLVSSLFAVLISGFWFFESVRLVSVNIPTLHNSAYFGKFLAQTPGWWTVLEGTVLLIWTLWAVNLTKVEF